MIWLRELRSISLLSCRIPADFGPITFDLRSSTCLSQKQFVFFFNDEWLWFWLEVLSLLKTVNTCASWLSNVLQWVAVCSAALSFFFVNVLF